MLHPYCNFVLCSFWYVNPPMDFGLKRFYMMPVCQSHKRIGLCVVLEGMKFFIRGRSYHSLSHFTFCEVSLTNPMFNVFAGVFCYTFYPWFCWTNQHSWLNSFFKGGAITQLSAPFLGRMPRRSRQEWTRIVHANEARDLHRYTSSQFAHRTISRSGSDFTPI